jgi:hypothetical protein
MKFLKIRLPSLGLTAKTAARDVGIVFSSILNNA